jgi:hypothetical protein
MFFKLYLSLLYLYCVRLEVSFEKMNSGFMTLADLRSEKISFVYIDFFKINI